MEHKRHFITYHRYVAPGVINERLLSIVDEYEKEGIGLDDILMLFYRELKFQNIPESDVKAHLGFLVFNKRVRHDLRRRLYYPVVRVL